MGGFDTTAELGRGAVGAAGAERILDAELVASADLTDVVGWLDSSTEGLSNAEARRGWSRAVPMPFARTRSAPLPS